MTRRLLISPPSRPPLTRRPKKWASVFALREKFLFLCVFGGVFITYFRWDLFLSGGQHWDFDLALVTATNLTSTEQKQHPVSDKVTKDARSISGKPNKGVTMQAQREINLKQSLTPKAVAYLKHPPKPDKHPYTPPPLNATTPLTDPYQHAILIPYRNRSFHLQQFIDFMHPYLQRHFVNHTFTLWVMEQGDQELFNRGWLTNVGLSQLYQHAPQTNCVILHDVDLIPNGTDSLVPYTTCNFPTHLSKHMENFNWNIPYGRYCGGVTSLSLKHWETINGMSNDYVGWGGEDDDLYHRLRLNGLLYQPDKKEPPVPNRPPQGQGAFKAISQSDEHHVQHKEHDNGDYIRALLDEMWRNSDRWQTEGYNEVYYTVVNSTTTKPPPNPNITNGTGGFTAIHQVKIIPQRSIQQQSTQTVTAPPILELLDIAYSGGDLITRAAARSNIVWGACHYDNYTKYDCHHAQKSGDWKYEGVVAKRSYQQSKTPWYLPMQEWKHTPMDGSTRFVVVRNPYDRAINFYRTWYDIQNKTASGAADHLKRRERADSLNAFLLKYFDKGIRTWKAPDFMRGVVDMMPQFDATGFPKTNDTDETEFERATHVLKYETLQEDLKQLMELYPHYQIKESFLTTELQKAEESSGSLKVTDLSPETITLINEIYLGDFKWWNYERLSGAPKVGTKRTLHPRKRTHRLVLGSAQLEFIPNPFTGLEGAITRAGARAGMVWGACHFDQFEEYECPPNKSGDLGDSLKFTLPTDQALEPWNHPIKTWDRNPYEKTKTFTVVMNPYARAIVFYRRMYDRRHDQPQGYRAEGGNNATDGYLEAREDQEMANQWLQEYFTKHHHPHRPDGLYLIPQSKLTAKLNYMPKAETLKDSLKKMFGRVRHNPLSEEVQSELLAISDASHDESLHKGKWLEIADLSDLTVAMINDIYRLDFFKFYPGMKMKTNATTMAYWKAMIPIPPTKTAVQTQPKGTKPRSQLATSGTIALKPGPKGTPKPVAADIVSPYDAATAFRAYTNPAGPVGVTVNDSFQGQSQALQSAAHRIEKYRAARGSQHWNARQKKKPKAPKR